MKFIEKLINILTLRTAHISQALLFFIVLVVTANIVMRTRWSPLPGTVELVEMSGAVMLATAVAYTAIKRGHIMVEVLVEKLPLRMQRIIDLFVSSAALVVLSFLTIETFKFAAKMMGRGYVTGHLKLPLAPSIYLVGAGFSMLAMVLLLDTLKAFLSLIKRGDEK